MITAQQMQEILLQYKKHGWNLRRVLLSAEAENFLSASSKTLFNEADIVRSEIDAAWFSRPSGAGAEAWEIRCLTGTPFALVEVFESEDDEDIREEARKEMETRLAQSTSKTRNQNLTA